MSVGLHKHHNQLAGLYRLCSNSPRRRLLHCQHPAASQQAASAVHDALHMQFNTLASLVSPETQSVTLSYTALGRGIVAQQVLRVIQRHAATRGQKSSICTMTKCAHHVQDLPAGTRCMTVDAFNLLCVTDEPLRTGSTFGSSTLSDWQLLHGDLPPILANYLVSSE